MGFASKLAAAQAQAQANPGSNPYGPPQTGYAPPSASYGTPSSFQSGPTTGSIPYGAPPAQPAYDQPPAYGQTAPTPSYGAQGQPQQQFGASQQHGAAQQYYGAPQPQGGQYPPPAQHPQAHGGGIAPDAILTVLRQCVQEQRIGVFYPQGSLEQLAQRISSSGALDRIAHEWRMSREFAIDLARLALFDIVLLCDDSGSMAFEEQGSRISDLKMVVAKIASAAGLFDQDGIQVRFLNSRIEGNNIANEQAAIDLVTQVKFSGLTPLGTELQRKILEPLVLSPARQGRLQKPVLVIIITDGEPGGEDRFTIVKVISEAKHQLGNTRYGSDAMSFQLAQVGNDQKARAFLEEIDSHPVIGSLVDTTSNYENEADNMAKASPSIDLTPELWLVKLLLGGIDSSYDRKDEK